MGGKKKGGSAHTPYEAPNTLHSKQIVKILDVLSEGPVEGLANGNTHPFKSIFFNDTPVQAENGSFNFQGFELAINDGDKDQTYLPGFDVVEKTVQVGVDVKRDTQINRTVSDPYVSSVRVTVGVKSLVEMKDNGDRLPTSVSMTVSLVKNGNYYASQVVSMHEKGTEPFYQDVTFNDLPEAPFEIRVTRNTPDSKTDKLQNATIFPSYVEIIDAKLSYQYLAMAGYKFDAMQFGSSLPRINTLLKGKIVPIPTNYDPVNRVYSGLWDGSFKMGWTDNPAWIVYEFAINKLYGGKLDPRFIDRASLYRVSQFCDELVDDGYGGKERRVTFNAYYTDSKPFRERLQEMCSSFFGKAIWNGQYVTFTLDIDDDPVAVYTNANVIDGDFSYEGISNSAVITTVNVQYYDAKDGYRQKTEVVEDYDLLRRYRTNVEKVVAEGCTSRSQAHRLGRYILEKSRLRTTVNFKVGAEGLRHRPFDVIQIADNHLAGANIGGRVLDVAGDIITLDRDVENAKDSKFSYLGVIDNKIKKIELEVTDQIAPNKLKLKEAPADLRKFSAWSISRSDVKPKYYRALAISPGNDGTFSIKAIEHELGLHERLANGLQFERDPNSVWSSFPVISNSTVGNNGDEVIITWDNINADTTSLTYTVKLYKDGKLYRTYSDLREPVLRFDNLPSGTYVAEVQAKNNRGQLSNILKQYFDLNYTITALTTHPELFAVKIKWQLPTIINTSISTEIWRAEKDEINEARLLVTLPYPQSEYLDSGKSATDSYYYWVRIIDKKGRTGEFTRSMLGEPKTDPSDITDILDEAIGEKQISKDLKDQFDKNIDDKIKEVEAGVNESIGKLELDNEKLNINVEKLNTDNININSNIEKLNVDDILSSISSANEGSTRHSQDSMLSANVADAFAQIEETNTVIVEKTSALAQKDTQLEASIGENKAKIEQIKVAQVDDQKSVAILKDEVKAQFDKNEADAVLSMITLATESETRSQQDLMLSANLGDAQAEIEETKSVIVRDRASQAEINTRIESKVDNNSAQIKANAQTQVDDKKSLTQQINDANSKIGANEAEISQIKTTQVDDQKSLAALKDDVKAQFNKNDADATLSLISLATESETRSQQDLKLSANVGSALSEIEETKTTIAKDKLAQAEINTRIESKADNNAAQIHSISQTQVTDRESLTQQINSAKSEIGENKAEIEQVKNTVVNNEESQALFKEDVKTRFDENEADATLSLISLSTESVTRSQQDLMLSANVAEAHAQIEETKGVIAEEKNSQAEINQRIESKVDNNSAQIKSISQTQTTDKESLTQEINSAKSEWRSANEVKYLTSSDTEKTPLEYADLYGRTTVVEFGGRAHFGLDVGTYHTVTTTISYLTGLDRGRVTQRAVSNDFAVTVRERKSASEDTWTPWVEIEDVAGAQAKADAAQKEAVRISKASIDSLAQTQASDKQALTEQINRANSSIDGHSASITEIRKTQADTAGKVASMWTMKVDANGAIGGIMLGSDGKESQLKFAADSFIVSTGNQDKNLFAIQRIDGRDVAFLNTEDFILKGSFSADKIAASSFKGYKFEGVEINAGHFYGGNISIGGTKSNPNFSVDSNGNLIAKSGRFEGTVYAEKIEGDVVEVVSIDLFNADEYAMGRLEFTVQPKSHARKASIFIPPFNAHVNGKVGIDKATYRLLFDGRVIASRGPYVDGSVVDFGTSFADIPAGKACQLVIDGGGRGRIVRLRGSAITITKGSVSENRWTAYRG